MVISLPPALAFLEPSPIQPLVPKPVGAMVHKTKVLFNPRVTLLVLRHGRLPRRTFSRITVVPLPTRERTRTLSEKVSMTERAASSLQSLLR